MRRLQIDPGPVDYGQTPHQARKVRKRAIVRHIRHTDTPDNRASLFGSGNFARHATTVFPWNGGQGINLQHVKHQPSLALRFVSRLSKTDLMAASQ